MRHWRDDFVSLGNRSNSVGADPFGPRSLGFRLVFLVLFKICICVVSNSVLR